MGMFLFILLLKYSIIAMNVDWHYQHVIHLVLHYMYVYTNDMSQNI